MYELYFLELLIYFFLTLHYVIFFSKSKEQAPADRWQKGRYVMSTRYVGHQIGSFKDPSGNEINFAKLYCLETNNNVRGLKSEQYKMDLDTARDLEKNKEQFPVNCLVKLYFDKYGRVVDIVRQEEKEK